MILQRLLLQNFRSYETADFSFDPGITYIIGPNTAGKSNIIEAIFLLSYGKSFRTEKDEQLIQLEKAMSRVKGLVVSERKNYSSSKASDAKTIEVFLAKPGVASSIFTKRYFLNGLPKRRSDFAGTSPALLFEPSDLDIVSGSPSLRRGFLDEVLEQTDKEYRHDLLTYTKALRQRNALLQRAKESGIRQEKQFSYWDDILIRAGTTVTQKRSGFIEYVNTQKKELFLLSLTYDPSILSEERLLQYKEAEVGAGVTLVGPHRDDFILEMKREGEEGLSLKSFGSRGQQRLAVLQLKLLQLQYMQENVEEKPLLLLDDIFSELDEIHIQHILRIITNQQTIITTTHKEFIEAAGIGKGKMIELG